MYTYTFEGLVHGRYEYDVTVEVWNVRPDLSEYELEIEVDEERFNIDDFMEEVGVWKPSELTHNGVTMYSRIIDLVEDHLAEENVEHDNLEKHLCDKYHELEG